MLKELAGKAFDISNQSEVISGTPLGNIGGVNVFVHGNPLNNLENSLIHKHLTALTEDYPEVASESVKSLHVLNPSIMNPRQIRALGEIPMFRRVLEQSPLGFVASGLAMPVTEDNPGGGLILNNPIIRMGASRYGAHKSSLNYMVSQDPGSTASSKAVLGETLDHEFGHHVQFLEAQKAVKAGKVRMEAYGTPGTEYELINSLGGVVSPEDIRMNERLWPAIDWYHNQHLLSVYQKHFPQFTNNPPPAQEPAIGLRNIIKQAKEQQRTRVLGMAFDPDETIDMLGSSYASTNSKELFAETFARARKGIGPGVEAAQGFIDEVAPVAKRAKMLKSAESAIQGLLDMRK